MVRRLLAGEVLLPGPAAQIAPTTFENLAGRPSAASRHQPILHRLHRQRSRVMTAAPDDQAGRSTAQARREPMNTKRSLRGYCRLCCLLCSPVRAWFR